MARPPRIPDRGDIPKSLVARRLGLSVDDFELHRHALEKRGFPEPDPTTGLYAIEAVDKWRLRRYPRLYPEHARAPGAAIDASAVFTERLSRIHD